MFDPRLNQLSSQIAQMTPQQRQQFALMHKNDPILVSLTKFVNDQDQAVKTALLAKQAPQLANQPKVVDQTIAQMSQPMGGPPVTPPPKASQGVAGLPAPNLAGMPDGGIAGQPDAQQAPQGPGMAKGGQVRRFDLGGFTGYTGDPLSDTYGGTVDPMAPQTQSWREQLGRTSYAGRGHVNPPLLGPVQSPYEIEREKNMAIVNGQNAKPQVQGPPASAQPTDLDQARATLNNLIANGPGGAPSGGASARGPGMKPGRPGAGGIAALPGGSGALGMKMPTTIDPSAKYDEMMDDRQARGNPMQDQLDDLTSAREDAADEHLAATKQRIEDSGIAGLDREKRLNERGKRIDANYNENSATALLSAGLAMMSGTSPNAWANIGNGAQVGLKQFTEGKAKLDDARDRLDDAFGQLEELRHNEQRMNAKDLQEAKEAKTKAIVDNMHDVLNSTAQMYDVDSKTASHIVDGYIQQAGHQMDLYGRVQSADITGRYSLAGAQAHAGAIAQSARLGYDANIFHSRVMGASNLANAMHDPMRYGLGSLAPKDYARFYTLAESEVGKDMSMLGADPATKEAAINRRAEEMAARAMQQSGGAGSSMPATPQQDPNQGWGQLRRAQ